jgi:3-isopropylmalate/(R)-2-methylmalate dehydratase small subunit
MTPFTVLRAGAVVLDLGIVDTDQIIPARFLKFPRGPAYRDFLFHDRRAQGAGTDAFPLDRPDTAEAQILISTGEFGVGSAREGAVWALGAFGFRAVVAPRFGDTVQGNCIRNGVLPVALPPEPLARLRAGLTDAGAELEIDLPRQEIKTADAPGLRFEIDPFDKELLLRGVDEIALTDAYLEAIEGFEAQNLEGPGHDPR